MGHRDVPVYALFEAHLGCPQDASDDPNADFDAAVCLRVVGRRRLGADLLDVLAIHLDHFQGCLHEGLDGRLSVGFQDETGMAEPFDVSQHHVGHEAVFVGTLARYNVRKEDLEL